MSHLKVCMVVNNLDVGGLEKVVINLIKYLPPLGIDPYLVCLSGKGTLFDDAGLPPEKCLVLDKSAVLPGVTSKLATFRYVLAIRKFLRETGVHIVHVHNLAPLLFGGMAARLMLRRPAVVYTDHYQTYLSDPAACRRFRWYARLADHIIAVSHDLKRLLVDSLGVSRRVEVVHNGIDGKAFRAVDGTALREELGAAESDVVFGTAVRITEQKGIRYFIEAAALVLHEEPDARFQIAGDGPLRPELEQAVKELGIEDRISFLGYRSDTPRLISSFDVYILPSLWEGLPLALLEALALGKPIVATTVGGNAEVIEEEVNGLLVPPKDPRRLADAMLRMYREPALRDSARHCSRKRFDALFSVQTMAANHVAVYSRVTVKR